VPGEGCGGARRRAQGTGGGTERGENEMSQEFETESVSTGEALQMQILTTQALIDVLVDKGLVTYQEIMARVEALQKEHGLG
jgi:hypothetical protein